jgi:Tfp pilus assembly protein PilF
MKTIDALLAIVLLLLATMPGCSGGDAGDPDLRRTAEQSLTEGRDALAAGDYQQAFDRLSEAAKGGLNADLYSEALVLHAVAAGHLGKFDLAENDFEVLEQGATNMADVLAAKSFVRGKQGNAAESKALLTQARKLNPRVKAFE